MTNNEYKTDMTKQIKASDLKNGDIIIHKFGNISVTSVSHNVIYPAMDESLTVFTGNRVGDGLPCDLSFLPDEIVTIVM